MTVEAPLTLGALRKAGRVLLPEEPARGSFTVYVSPDLVPAARDLPNFTPVEKYAVTPGDELGKVELFRVRTAADLSGGSWRIEWDVA